MSIHNFEIAEKFNELADFLELDNADPFRVRAYRNAARNIKDSTHELADLVLVGEDLTKLPGIGEALAQKIETIVATGTLPALDKIKKKIPPTVRDMMDISGLGPKRVRLLYTVLKIKGMDDLKKAIEAGKVTKLEGFGDKTVANIQKAITAFQGRERRILLADADKIVQDILAYLKKMKGIEKTIVAGSYRRRKETIGDLDVLVTAQKSAPVIKYFVAYPEIGDILSQGNTRASVKLRSGMQVDVRVVAPNQYGAALQYFTGSKAHSIVVRKLAVAKKLKINEYGVFKGNKRIAGKTEKEVYRSVGLPYIVPELRENRGEIEAATVYSLPKLVERTDIRGDLHCHTTASDGRNSLEEMVRAAQKMGYEYIAITDHSKHITIARGLDKKRLKQQIKKIDALNQKITGIRILKSIECDILEDGTLDLPDDILKELDVVTCAIHYKFNLSRAKQTERVLRAMDNPYFNIYAHPTCRLIEKRNGIDIDLEKIMHAAKEQGCFLELNAHPERLDLDDVYCKMAKEIGLKVSLGTDSHATSSLQYMQYGIDQARRGWLEPNDILNTRGWPALKKLLQR